MESSTGNKGWTFLASSVISVSVVFGSWAFLVQPFFFPRLAPEVGRASDSLPLAVKAAQARGIPLEARDLPIAYGVSAEDNAAPLFRAIEKELSEHQAVHGEVNGCVASGNLSRAAFLLEPFDPLLDRIRSESEGKRLDMKRDWDLTPALAFPDYAEVKAAGALLCARASLRVKLGLEELAFADLKAALRLASLLTEEASLTSQLVATAIRSMVLRAALSGAEGSSNLGIPWEEAASFDPPDPARAFAMEAYQSVTVARNFLLYESFGLVEGNDGKDTSGLREQVAKRVQRTGLPVQRVNRAAMERALRVWIEVDKVLKRSVSGRQKASDLYQIHQRVVSDPKQDAVLVRRFLGALPEVYASFLDSPVRAAVTRTAIQVVNWKKRKGRWPSSLVEAGIKAPDPYGRGPLRFKRTPKGFLVWSVGLDGVDDGGLKEAPPAPGRPQISSFADLSVEAG